MVESFAINPLETCCAPILLVDCSELINISTMQSSARSRCRLRPHRHRGCAVDPFQGPARRNSFTATLAVRRSERRTEGINRRDTCARSTSLIAAEAILGNISVEN